MKYDYAIAVVEDALAKHGIGRHPGLSLARSIVAQLFPEPQVISTIEEMEQLDPETFVMDRHYSIDKAASWWFINGDGERKIPQSLRMLLPAVVISPGEQIQEAIWKLSDAKENMCDRCGYLETGALSNWASAEGYLYCPECRAKGYADES